ncbi:MAG: ATP-binding cassette domain-containing protein [Acidobacteriota bacterium]|nr:ATP-binding cassette domain-containing protein [Acidobacteriota bacterium]
MDVALSLDRVTKKFGDYTAVNAVSAAIPRGCIYGFLGPNGAGKTTTIRMIMSILYPDAGEIQVLGSPNSESMKNRLGYLPEEKGLYKKMKVGDLVTYFGQLKGLSGRDARKRGRELLERWNLGEWIDKKCDALSKGMGQKVQIISTLIHDPELVILDEPFSGLDPVNVEVVRDVVLQMKRDGKTVIFSTHVMSQAEQMCDYIMLINDGNKILDGPMAEVRGSAGGSVIIEYEGDGTLFDRLPGVTRVNDAGKEVELTLVEGTDPQDILARLIGKISIRRFDMRAPSLHEIFIRAVGGVPHG